MTKKAPEDYDVEILDVKYNDKEDSNLPPDPRRTKGKYKWTPKATKILLMTQRGAKIKAIAAELGVSTKNVCEIQRKPEFQDKLLRINERATEKLIERAADETIEDKIHTKMQQAALKAVDKIIATMNNRPKRKSENHREKKTAEKRLEYEAAKDILDRAGYKAIDIVETRERVYTPEETEAMKSTLIQMEEIAGRLTKQDSSFLLDKKSKSN